MAEDPNNDYRKGEIAFSEWEGEATVMVDHIKTFVNEDGLVKFEDVEYLGDEIYELLKWSKDFDNGDDGLYDFTPEAKDMLKGLSFSLV